MYGESLRCFSQGLQAVFIGNFTVTKKRVDSGHLQPNLQQGIEHVQKLRAMHDACMCMYRVEGVMHDACMYRSMGQCMLHALMEKSVNPSNLFNV